MAVPKRVDHAIRRRQITDAVCRLTLKGGLTSATFREVAAEADVSVRLVQYYFGSKDQLLLSTLQHVADRATARITERVARAGGDPRAALRALLVSFVPVDVESRENMLMFVALHTASLTDRSLAREEALHVPRSLHGAIRAHLERLSLREGVEVELEAVVLASLVPSLAQGVLSGAHSSDAAVEVIDYALARVVRE